MRLTMLGRPGAGKGTQGALLAEHWGIPHISTGSIFREAIRSHSPLGELAKRYIDRGHLVPDDIAIEIVKARLSAPDCRDGYILDGFPRTVAQAKALDEALGKEGCMLDAAVEIHISDEEAVQRIAHRRVCAVCGATYFRGRRQGEAPARCERCGGALVRRDDDTEETARERLAVYLAQTHPVVSYYAERGRLITVDGEQGIRQVFEDLLAALSRLRVGSGSSGVM